MTYVICTKSRKLLPNIGRSHGCPADTNEIRPSFLIKLQPLFLINSSLTDPACITDGYWSICLQSIIVSTVSIEIVYNQSASSQALFTLELSLIFLASWITMFDSIPQNHSVRIPIRIGGFSTPLPKVSQTFCQ